MNDNIKIGDWVAICDAYDITKEEIDYSNYYPCLITDYDGKYFIADEVFTRKLDKNDTHHNLSYDNLLVLKKEVQDKLYEALIDKPYAHKYIRYIRAYKLNNILKND